MTATSPDDKAFFNCMEFMGFKIIKRVADRIYLSIIGERLEVKLVDTMPFDSYRKKMSIVIKLGKDKYVLYTKGADSAVVPYLNCSKKE